MIILFSPLFGGFVYLFTIYTNKQLNKRFPFCLNGSIKQTKQLNKQKREQLLSVYRAKQPFRVAIGKSKWLNYELEEFDERYNLREVLYNEIVIEFDSGLYEKEKKKDWEDMTEQEQQYFRDKISWPGINFSAINLYRAGITFQIWDHGGKSPHLHIHDLPIANLELSQRSLFKKLFIRKYVPLEYLPYADTSLTGIHLLAIEWQVHWKGCYGVKELLYEFNPLEVMKK